MGKFEYRIEYQIQRRDADSEDDFVEIGFGSSGAWDRVNEAEFAMGSDIQNRGWETEKGQPDAAEVDR